MSTILMAIVFLLCTNRVLGQPEDANEQFTIAPDKIVERVDMNASIRCSFPSPATVTNWGVGRNGMFHFINPDNSTNVKVSADSRTLLFIPVRPGDEGEYYCWVALSERDSIYSETVSLTILNNPVVVNQDKSTQQDSHTYNLTVRREATLNIITTGKPIPDLTLYKKAKPSGEYVEVTSDRFAVTLVKITISSVEPEDEGDYKLNATYITPRNETLSDAEEFTIEVHIPPTRPTLMLELLNATAMKDARVIARIGTRVAISCRMTEAYTNNLDIYWSTTNETRSEFSVEQSVTEVHLVIDVVDRKNAGMYTCIAVNREGGALLAVDLVVGSVPEQFEVTVTSFNNALIVRWEEGNNAKSRDERILAFYVQYKAVNGSNRDTMVKRFAASVKETTLRNVEPDVQYLVRMWSENSFGNSSATDKEFVVIDETVIETSSVTQTQSVMPTESSGGGGGGGGGSSITNTNQSTNSSNDGVVVGVVVGVCILVVLVFCTVIILLVVLYLNNRRIQAQQQWQKDPEFQSQLSLSAGSMRVPHIPSSESMPPPVPIYAMPYLNNGFSSSSISKRSSEENNWQIPRDNIQLSELLAEGEHTVLYRATVFSIGKFKKTTEVTVKQVKDNNSSPEEVKVLIEEMDLMRDLGIHPNVVNVLAVCTVGDPVYLLMDYFAHGDLLGFLRATRGHTEHYTVSAGTETKVPQCTVQPQDLLSLASQVANGMTFLEEKKLAHRSLCARNVLVGTGLQIKIYNYGQKNDDQSSYAKWMAPETLFDGTANTTSDVWSFGVTLWEIVTIGGSPYFQMRPEDMRKVLEDGYRMPNPDHCSEEIYKIMQDCWEYDPQDRPAFDLISYRLETLSKSKLSFIDLKLYDEVLYSQFEDTPTLCTAL